MMTPSADHTPADWLDRLALALEAEQAALLAGDALAVEHLASEKQTLCQEIERRASTWALTPELRERLRGIERANRANGAMVGLLLRHTEATLAALQSAGGGDGAALSLYRGDGQAAGGLGGRALGKA